MIPRRFPFALPRFTSLSPVARVAIVLLALLQIVAPTWHICEMGGYAGTRHTVSDSPVWKVPACGGGPKCVCKREAFPPGTTFLSNHEVCGATHCLARVLMGMPAHAAPAISLDIPLLSRRSTGHPHPKYFDGVALALSPARGPPYVSV
ncbi:MAG: hypothetical protein JWN98_1540 [Abditibacteriota bacterium]|nr:hypothetical protein [Abditibacteriota bacterium]